MINQLINHLINCSIANNNLDDYLAPPAGVSPPETAAAMQPLHSLTVCAAICWCIAGRSWSSAGGCQWWQLKVIIIIECGVIGRCYGVLHIAFCTRGGVRVNQWYWGVVWPVGNFSELEANIFCLILLLFFVVCLVKKWSDTFWHLMYQIIINTILLLLSLVILDPGKPGYRPISTNIK